MRKLRNTEQKWQLGLTTALLLTASFGFLDRVWAQPEELKGASEPATRPEIYGQGVRETDWQSPEQERAGFHLPPGFSAHLFASEPMIDKPLNMAWDSKGRLWITSTVEYPYPATDKPRDRVLILEDSDGDGRADKSTVFAEGLNIPMGILPMQDGAIVFSIPNLLYIRDTDGDLRADTREVLLGPFDTTRDTHGMVNALRRGNDGWIYACHGFNNQSNVVAADGSRADLQSGNIFRFRPDGSQVQLYTKGQVNPFGLTQDEWGNWYSADCHSKPLTALLPGGCYPSFGRPHDGLGFAPEMMQHLHASTAISGLVYYRAEHFPAAYRRQFYSGNVMTSRINCNSLHWRGATASAIEQPDFLTSDDPWFRPVDLQVGIDGQLYIADFYNKIIGHYEVPLEHPGRDRDSGRIWRIQYDLADRPKAAPEDLIERLASGNATVSELAIAEASTQLRAARDSAVADQALTSELLEILRDPSRSPGLRQSCLETLALADHLNFSEVFLLTSSSESRLAQLAISIGREESDYTAAERKQLNNTVRQQLDHTSAQVQKAAVQYLGVHGDAADCVRLLDILHDNVSRDPALAHMAKIATRDLLRSDDRLAMVEDRIFRAEPADAGGHRQKGLLAVLQGLNSAKSTERLLRLVVRSMESPPPDATMALGAALDLAMQHISSIDEELLVSAIEMLAPADLDVQTQWLEKAFANDRSTKKNGESNLSSSPSADRPLERLHSEVLDRLVHKLSTWEEPCIEWQTREGTSWPQQLRENASGDDLSFWSSHPLGETYTGQLRSEPFPCPESLEFWICGHNGFPGETDHQKNFVRIVDAISQTPLRTALPPRNDLAMRVNWELAEHQGQKVVVEIVDQDPATAYAWIAVGGFSRDSLNHNEMHTSIVTLGKALSFGNGQSIVRVAEKIAQLENTQSKLSEIQRARLVLATLTGLKRQADAAIVEVALRTDKSDLVTWKLILENDVATKEDSQTSQLARKVCGQLTVLQQQLLARQLISSPQGCRILADLIGGGQLATAALRGGELITTSSLDSVVIELIESTIKTANNLEAETVDASELVSKLNGLKPDIANGQAIFKQHCANCHQLGGQGNVIGPQLDGAISRSYERLVEDIFLPSLNVDQAFRTSSFLLDNGDVVSGLASPESDSAIRVVLTDSKQVIVHSDAIVERRNSSKSLMPDNFREALNDQQLVDLLHFMASFRN